MQRIRKSKRNIDYNHFHLTGEKVTKGAEHNLITSGRNSNMSDEDLDKKDGASQGNARVISMSEMLLLQLEYVADDIDDFINKTPIREIEDSISDLDLVIKRIEEMRSQYRTKLRN